ncbi:Fe-S oxidoreductase [Clostridium acetobutylicum]|nr:Fe-S oxidoreductase [Clostridium acetobutylicum]
MNEKKFGFGCMRLPLLDKEDPTSFDYDLINKLFDMYLEKGFTYFDTAYTYHGYHGEEGVRKALVERHLRDEFQLATKLPLRDFKDSWDMERIFNEQLSNCGVDFFDFYLLHNMGSNVFNKCEKYGAFDFVAKKKAEGKIKVVGMSFHDTPELLDKILSKYTDKLDFIQLQINYVDWNQPNVNACGCLEIANKYNKPVTVMEPCKGGTLVNVPKEAEKLMRDYNPNYSIASWAFRYAASQKGVFRVLSGMNTIEQVEDNASFMQNFEPLNEEEMAIIEKVTKIINENTAVPCTACEYCTHGCPKNIPIPKYFSLYNSIMRTTGSFSSQMVYYNNIAINHGKASECIGCKQCESECPQHIKITTHLKDVVEKFEKNNIIPTRKI